MKCEYIFEGLRPLTASNGIRPLMCISVRNENQYGVELDTICTRSFSKSLEAYDICNIFVELERLCFTSKRFRRPSLLSMKEHWPLM
jgi:hypothetical protein